MGLRRYAEAGELARLARGFGPRPASLPGLFAFTDPDRRSDVVALAQALPPGAGLVLRTYGRPHMEAQARPAAQIAAARGLTFLVAADPQLAAWCGADGVHWPEAQLGKAPKWRDRFAVMSASAHSPMALRQSAGLVDLVFVSTAFASSSASAHRALGPFRLASFARGSACPVYALGGVTIRTVKRLKGLGVSGVAAIEGLGKP